MHKSYIGVSVKYLSLCFCILFVYSCSTTQYSSSEVDKISIDMGVLNQRLVGYLYRKKMDKNLIKINEAIYVESVNEIKDPSEIEYTSLFEKKSVEYKVKGIQNDFIVCLKDSRPLLILCDVGSTPFVEKVLIDQDVQLEKIFQEINFPNK